MWIGICDSAKRILGTLEAFLEKASLSQGNSEGATKMIL